MGYFTSKNRAGNPARKSNARSSLNGGAANMEVVDAGMKNMKHPTSMPEHARVSAKGRYPVNSHG